MFVVEYDFYPTRNHKISYIGLLSIMLFLADLPLYIYSIWKRCIEWSKSTVSAYSHPLFLPRHIQIKKWSYLNSLTKTIHALTHIKIMGVCAHYKYSLNTWYVPLYKNKLLIIHSHFTHIIYWLLLDKYCLSVKVEIFLKHFNDILQMLQGVLLTFLKSLRGKKRRPCISV